METEKERRRSTTTQSTISQLRARSPNTNEDSDNVGVDPEYIWLSQYEEQTKTRSIANQSVVSESKISSLLIKSIGSLSGGPYWINENFAEKSVLIDRIR